MVGPRDLGDSAPWACGRGLDIAINAKRQTTVKQMVESEIRDWILQS
jgi:hypothetical protein